MNGPISQQDINEKLISTNDGLIASRITLYSGCKRDFQPQNFKAEESYIIMTLVAFLKSFRRLGDLPQLSYVEFTPDG
jgi:hypothetical protein